MDIILFKMYLNVKTQSSCQRDGKPRDIKQVGLGLTRKIVGSKQFFINQELSRYVIENIFMKRRGKGRGHGRIESTVLKKTKDVNDEHKE